MPQFHRSTVQKTDASKRADHRAIEGPRPCDLVCQLLPKQCLFRVVRPSSGTPPSQSLRNLSMGSPYILQSSLGGGNRTRGRLHDDPTPGSIKASTTPVAPLTGRPTRALLQRRLSGGRYALQAVTWEWSVRDHAACCDIFILCWWWIDQACARHPAGAARSIHRCVLCKCIARPTLSMVSMYLWKRLPIPHARSIRSRRPDERARQHRSLTSTQEGADEDLDSLDISLSVFLLHILPQSLQVRRSL